MAKIKVLIVDDSFFMRKLLRELFVSYEHIEVVGDAKSGAEAVAAAKKLKPDVITMDYNMPGMNGAEATAEIMKGERPLPAIIMVSAATREGAEETFKSLRAGAVDFVTKPSGEVSLDIEKVGAELAEKIRVVAGAHIERPKWIKREVEVKKVRERKEQAPQLVIIGSSTGGPPAVEDILSALPGDLKIAIIVVQHMPEKFTKSFANRLNKVCAFNVDEAQEGDVIHIGSCLVAPGNFHLEVVRQENGFERVVHLNQEAPMHGGLRPAIDITMKSVVENFTGGILGIILTGMGRDGADGMAAIKERGGYTIVQSPETAVIDSMPKAAIEQGAAREVVPLKEIAKRIMELSSK